MKSHFSGASCWADTWASPVRSVGKEDCVYRSRTMGGRMSCAAFGVVDACPVVGVLTAPPLSLRYSKKKKKSNVSASLAFFVLEKQIRTRPR